MGSKPNVVVYVTRAGLAMVGRKTPSARLALPDDLVMNLEVLSVERLTEYCQQFFEDHNLKSKRVLIVLGLSVMFEKTIALDKAGNPGALTKAFVDAMPFEKGQRACMAINNGDHLQLYAANSVMYLTLVEALKLARTKVVAVTPARAYHLVGGDKSFEALAAQFLRDTKALRTANFLEATVY